MAGIQRKSKSRTIVARDEIWKSIRKRQRFVISDIEFDTHLEESVIRTYVTGLTRAGYLSGGKPIRVKGQFKPAEWQLIEDIGVQPPAVTRDGVRVIKGIGREQMWRTMKMLSDFDKKDLAVHASTEARPVTLGEAAEYISNLNRAGYLVQLKNSKAGTNARYRLLPSKNTGPRAPVSYRVRQVFDPNLSEVVYEAAGGTL